MRALIFALVVAMGPACHKMEASKSADEATADEATQAGAKPRGGEYQDFVTATEKAPQPDTAYRAEAKSREEYEYDDEELEQAAADEPAEPVAVAEPVATPAPSKPAAVPPPPFEIANRPKRGAKKTADTRAPADHARSTTTAGPRVIELQDLTIEGKISKPDGAFVVLGEKGKDKEQRLQVSRNGFHAEDQNAELLAGLNGKRGRRASGEALKVAQGQHRLDWSADGDTGICDGLDADCDGRFGFESDRWKQDEGERSEAPATFIPDQCYFENTYLGGSAAYL